VRPEKQMGDMHTVTREIKPAQGKKCHRVTAASHYRRGGGTLTSQKSSGGKRGGLFSRYLPAASREANKGQPVKRQTMEKLNKG